MPLWCVHRVHIAWIQTGPDEWSQWVLSVQARTLRFLNSADLSSMPTTVRRQQMAQFDGCRQWPWPHEICPQSNFQMTSPDDCKAFHPLVDPLWVASFWRNADASLKQGVRLAHEKSHEIIIPSGLLRWSYGRAPDVSPPARTDWRRGASRRRRRSNRGSSTEFLLSVDDAGADGGDGHADGDHGDDGAGGADDADGADDDGIDMRPTTTTVVVLLSVVVITMADMKTVTAAFTTMATMTALMIIRRLAAMRMAVMMMTLDTATPTRAMISTHTIATTTATTIVVVVSMLTYCFRFLGALQILATHQPTRLTYT